MRGDWAPAVLRAAAPGRFIVLLMSDYAQRLCPGRKAQSGPGSRRRAVAGHVFEPVEVEVLDGASERHPVQDFRRAGVELVTRKVAQKICVLVGAGFQDGAIEIFVHQKMAQAPGSEN